MNPYSIGEQIEIFLYKSWCDPLAWELFSDLMDILYKEERMKKSDKLYRGWAVVSKKGQVHDMYTASNKRLATGAAKWLGENWTVVPFCFDPVPRDGESNEEVR